MHQRLEETQATVESLQALLTGESRPAPTIEIRRLPGLPVLATTATVTFDGCAAWLDPAIADLRRAADARGLTVTGPEGALYPDAFFEDAVGDVTAFLPVGTDGPDTDGSGDRAIVDLAPVTVAVLLHEGTFADLDQAYGALGSAVAGRGIGGPGPIREHYLDPTRTEVCWPVTAGAAG
jgi:hypothetical protein